MSIRAFTRHLEFLFPFIISRLISQFARDDDRTFFWKFVQTPKLLPIKFDDHEEWEPVLDIALVKNGTYTVLNWPQVPLDKEDSTNVRVLFGRKTMYNHSPFTCHWKYNMWLLWSRFEHAFLIARNSSYLRKAKLRSFTALNRLCLSEASSQDFTFLKSLEKFELGLTKIEYPLLLPPNIRSLRLYVHRERGNVEPTRQHYRI